MSAASSITKMASTSQPSLPKDAKDEQTIKIVGISEGNLFLSAPNELTNEDIVIGVTALKPDFKGKIFKVFSQACLEVAEIH